MSDPITDQDTVRRDLERASDRMRRLQLLTTELSGAMTAEHVARVVLEAGSGAVGAHTAALWGFDGKVATMLAQSAPQPAAPQYALVSMDVPAPLTKVLLTGEAMWIEDHEQYAAHFPVAEPSSSSLSIGSQGVAILPLAVNGVVLGAIGFAFAMARRFASDEREFVSLLTRHAAVALERAQLFAEQVRARAELAWTARRLQKLQDATAALAEARTPREVAAVTVRLGAEAVDAQAAVVWLAGLDGSLAVVGSHGIAEDYLAAWRRVAGDPLLPAARVLATGHGIWVETDEDFRREAPELHEHARAAASIWSFVMLPLASGGRTVGVLSFSYPGEHRFPEEERQFLAALTRTCEHALERARLDGAEAEARRIAEAANLRKDEFLAMLGHELRNPLAAIVSALEVIKARDGALDRELAVMDRQVGHLVHLVGDLVDVSRVTRGTITLRRETVDVAGAVEHAIATVKPLLDGRTHALDVNVPDHLVVDADRDRLAQVLANLLANAAKYTPQGGRIEVTADLEGPFVRISVRDNGAGITAALLPTLFELFVQGERAPDRRDGGLGVGLAVVRNLVELHGGTVTADSAGAGAGATFTVLWPKASSRTSTARIPALRRPEARRLRVLIVDDNADAAEMLGGLMQVLGHDPVIVHDGPSALAAVEADVPHVALLDIGLPGMDGYDLAARLRLLPKCATISLIAITGYGEPEHRERSRRAGFAHHLVKPIDTAELSEALRPIAWDAQDAAE
ncbi:MAG: GAF domain-containing protein [Deltaproteobacteria bacterium]|nr:GAF domain-containing protein [Deltaproteobacteria bacterium]